MKGLIKQDDGVPYYTTRKEERGKDDVGNVGLKIQVAQAQKDGLKKKDPRSRRLDLQSIIQGTAKGVVVDNDNTEQTVENTKEDAVYAVATGRSLADAEHKLREAQAVIKREAGKDVRDKLVAAVIDESAETAAETAADSDYKSLKKEYERLKKEEPLVFLHAQLSYLIRKVEIATDKITDNGIQVGADLYLREAEGLKRFRFATTTEIEAVAKKEKTLPSHTVIGHGIVIVPLELTKANKVLAERLIALVKAEKALFKKRELDKVAAKVADMKAKATITLTEILRGKVPPNGQRSIIFLSSPASKVTEIGREKWLWSFNLLLEVRDNDSLHILQVSGSDKMIAVYEKMKSEDRYLKLRSVVSGKIMGLKGSGVKEAHTFLDDVFRGLRNEATEAQRAEKETVVAEKEAVAKDAVTVELAEMHGVKMNEVSVRKATQALDEKIKGAEE